MSRPSFFFARGYIRAFDVENNTFNNIPRNAIFGQQLSRLDFHTYCEEDFLMVMVVFKPGALFRLLGLSSHELTTHYENAESYLSAELRDVNDFVANSKSYTLMLKYVESYLLKKCRMVKRERHPIDLIANTIKVNPHRFSLDWLADQANLSPRQFQRKYIERIGIGPKLYARISRFSQAFSAKDQHPEIDWLTLALRFGYTDYYHMAKDFKQFACTTPGIILEQYQQRPEIVLKRE